jgi:hypothetical protein
LGSSTSPPGFTADGAVASVLFMAAQLIESRKRELLCTRRKDTHAVTLEKRPVHGVGEELILSVNAHCRRTRVPVGRAVANAGRDRDGSEARGARMANLTDLDHVILGEALLDERSRTAICMSRRWWVRRRRCEWHTSSGHVVRFTALALPHVMCV